MEYINKHKTVIVASHPENSYYKKLKAVLDANGAISQGIKDRNLDLIQDTIQGSDFNIYLYGQDGSLHFSDNTFTDETFTKLFAVSDALTPKPASQTGGSKNVNYREKYFKYKNKYEDMKNVITSFTSHSYTENK